MVFPGQLDSLYYPFRGDEFGCGMTSIGYTKNVRRQRNKDDFDGMTSVNKTLWTTSRYDKRSDLQRVKYLVIIFG